MTRVYSSLDWLQVHNFKNILESHGIPCVVRGEYRSSVMGQVPLTECFTELWVLEDRHVEDALKIMQQDELAPKAQSWMCKKCGEVIEGQFDQCWQCGNPGP